MADNDPAEFSQFQWRHLVAAPTAAQSFSFRANNMLTETFIV